MSSGIETTEPAAGVLLAAALDFALAGLPVLPLDGKVPRNRGGLTSASTDTAVVSDWWKRWPAANVGVRTGAASGFVVLDVDGPAGLGSLQELERRHGKLTTAQVLTGSGGWHYWFRHPGREIPNSASKIAPGLDVRGDGGYIVAPPSIHESGNPYRWTRDLDRVEDWPAWLAEQAAERRNGATVVGETIPEGSRDATLASLAGTMRRRGMSETAILRALQEENAARCKPPLPEADIERIARSIAAKPPAEAGAAVAVLVATPLTEIEMRSIEWLEKPLWQRSAFELLGGVKGAGKGTYLAGLAARVSQAGANVLFVSTEDSTAIDLKPRLVAAGAILECCYVIQQHVRLPEHIDQLRELAHDHGGVGLLVIDPVANHIGDRNSNSDAEVRDAIAPLNKLADELACLIIGVRHPGKDRSHGAVASILGSTAWVDTPRAVVMIAVDDVDPATRVIQVVAGNRSLNGSAQAFRIDAVDVPGLAEPITVAVALGESSKDVDELLAPSKGDESKSAQARELILDILESEGEQESDTLDARVGKATQLSVRTVQNLRVELGKNGAGLIRSHPDLDESGQPFRWKVSRTGAPR